MNSHIDIADGSTNTKEVVQVIRDESEFSKNVTAITTKMAAIDVSVKSNRSAHCNYHIIFQMFHFEEGPRSV